MEMNQTCKVCGEPAAGFHFGAFTCEGCKSFFGRSYNNLTSISDCKNNGDCIINKKNRTACKACRLKKCLVVGMSKSGSRYGRRSNWFKIHCLLQEQQQQAAAAAVAATQPGGSGSALGGANSCLQEANARAAARLGHPHAAYSHAAAAAATAALYSRPPCTKEEMMLLGFETDYKHPSTSPSVSSPDSHNSDSSVEVGDRRQSLLHHGLPGPGGPRGLDGLHAPPPSALGFNKELFLPLGFPGMPMPPPGFMAPGHHHLMFPGYHPSLYAPQHQGLLKPVMDSHSQQQLHHHHQQQQQQHHQQQQQQQQQHHQQQQHQQHQQMAVAAAAAASATAAAAVVIANNNRNANNHSNGSSVATVENDEEAKRYFLDAMLKSQQHLHQQHQQRAFAASASDLIAASAPVPIAIDEPATDDNGNNGGGGDDDDEDVDEDLVVSMTPPRSPVSHCSNDSIGGDAHRTRLATAAENTTTTTNSTVTATTAAHLHAISSPSTIVSPVVLQPSATVVALHQPHHMHVPSPLHHHVAAAGAQLRHQSDIPIDLSMKTGETSSSRSSSLSPSLDDMRAMSPRSSASSSAASSSAAMSLQLEDGGGIQRLPRRLSLNAADDEMGGQMDVDVQHEVKRFRLTVTTPLDLTTKV